MKKGINLTLGRKRVDTIFKKAFFASVILFFVVVVISLFLIVYRLILKSSFEALDKKEQQLNQQLLTQVEKKDKFIEIKSRLVDIRKIISSRSPVIARINTVSSVIPFDSTINNLSGTDIEMEVSLESDNLVSLNDLMEQKLIEIASDKKKAIKKVEMKSFGLNPKTSLYTLTIGISFNKQ